MSDPTFLKRSRFQGLAILAGRIGQAAAAHKGLMASLVLFFLLLQLTTQTTCFMRATLGIPCPGCGLSRAYAAALRLDFSQALSHHPLFFLIPAGLLIYLWLKLRWPQALQKKTALAALIVAGGLFFGVYLWRMIFLFPAQEPMTFHQASLLGRVLVLLQALLSG